MGIECIVLENHRNIPVLGSNIIHYLAVDVEFAFGYIFEARYHSEGRGFSAAGRPDKNDEFLISNIKIEILYCHNTLIGYLKI